MKTIITLLTITLLFSLNTQAANITSSSAEYKNHRFIIKVVGIVSASPKNVFALLTDYTSLTQISPKIISSKIIKENSNIIIVETIAKGCIWFFCRKIINTQTTTSVPEKSIQAITIPSSSNLKFGKMLWGIREVESGTEIEYYAEIEPDFFFPPLIGTYFIKNVMLEEAKTFVNSVEKLANQDLKLLPML